MNMKKPENKTADMTRGHAAMIAGAALLLMAVLAPIAWFAILKTLIVPADAAKTVSNILASAGAFRMAVCFFLLVAVLDMIAAWALYILLKPVHKSLSLLAALFRIVYAGILSAALVNLGHVLHLLGGAEIFAAVDTLQLQSQVMLSLDSFIFGWDIGLIVFGFHLGLLGFILFKAGFMKRILGALILIASFGYLFDGFGKLIIPDFNYEIAMFTFMGEIVIIFWLFIKGSKLTDIK